MINILKESTDFTIFFLGIILLYNLHSNLELDYLIFDKTPINSIYIFNFLAVLFFLIISRLNVAHKLVNPLIIRDWVDFIKQ